MTETRIELEAYLAEDVRRLICDGVDFFNVASTGLAAYFPVNFVLRGDRGDVLGGLIGQLWGGWLQIFYLWVAEPMRGLGHGTSLMAAAEDYARVRGAIGSTLETYSFQARPFYERLGYEMFSVLKDYPPGHAKLFLKKELASIDTGPDGTADAQANL